MTTDPVSRYSEATRMVLPPAMDRAERRRCEQMPRRELGELQLARLNELAVATMDQCEFWRKRFTNVPFPLPSLDALDTLPLLTKAELVEATAQSSTALLTQPPHAYTRVHRTSGTTNRPILIYDTPADWEWWISTWQYVLDVADVNRGDRALMAFSYGPYIGFWSAHDALLRRGATVMPTGGMSTEARLHCLRDLQATIVCCTPTYAMRMLEVASVLQFDLRSLPVRVLIVAGEPGGSDARIRAPIEEGWDAIVVDHAGATELGPWGYADSDRRGLHIVESEFIAEFIQHSQSETDGADLFELVLTPLGRHGMPLFRYRTGDLVRPSYPAPQPNANQFVFLDGGIIGRADDMLVIRGVNVFPTALEGTIREVCPLAEYRIIVDRDGPLSELRLHIEADPASCATIARRFSTDLGLRVEVTAIAPGSLQRFDGKARRIVQLPEAPR